MDPVPAELKVITPFMQRAHECRNADKVLNYWCIMYAAQLAMSAKPKEADSTAYLLGLVDKLEVLREELKGNQAVTEEIAAYAYIENIALKVFGAADSEDRKGKATQKTARNFLVSSHFLDLLHVFGQPEADVLSKLKYAQWKAVDISKALREGRTPRAGPAVEPDEDREVAEALAQLVPPSDFASSASPLPPNQGLANGGGSVNLDTPIDSRSLGTGPSEFGAPGDERSAPGYPFPDPGDAGAGLPSAPSGSLPSPGFSSASTPPAPPPVPTNYYQPPPVAPPQPPPPSGPAPAVLDPRSVTQAQKHARWAVSALDYDDYETARKELRAALAIIGG